MKPGVVLILNFSWLPGFQIKESVSHLRKSGPRASVDKLMGLPRRAPSASSGTPKLNILKEFLKKW
jgi:hypothetical protein